MRIDRGIKIPKNLPRQYGKWIVVVDRMRKGDSILLNRENAESLQQAGNRYRGLKMIRRKIGNQKYRVWRA